MIKFKFLIILNAFLIFNSAFLTNAFTLEETEENSKLLSEGETTGACSGQLNQNLQERNCRYGRCEQIKNGTDYVCHCDNFITGFKCDRLVVDLTDGCASNPCWGESLCITLEDTNGYKCLCPDSRTGTYCHLINKNTDETGEEKDIEYSQESEIEKLTSLLTSLTSVFSSSESTTPTPTTSTTLTLPTTSNRENYTENIQLNTSTHQSHSTLSYNERITYSKLNRINQSISNTNESSNSTPLKFRPKLSNILINSIVPKTHLKIGCSFDTCQLGKCLSNGSCECVKPAYGKFCDQIDECLVLKCNHGSCETGKGCICDHDYRGPLCDILVTTEAVEMSSIGTTATTPTSSILTTMTTSETSKTTTNSPNIITLSITSTTSPSTSLTNLRTTSSQKLNLALTTKLFSTKKSTDILTQSQTNHAKNEFLVTPSMRFRKNSTTTNEPTTQFISNCENGGLLIDNVCICLNQFSGVICEIPPTFSDSSSSSILHTKAPELESIEPIIPKKVSNSSSQKQIETETNKIEDQQLIPIFTISRFNTKTKNITSQRSIYWPWFECFPGDSKIFSINKTNGKIEEKFLSSIKINDEILVIDNYHKNTNFNQSQFKFSRVISFLHKIDNIDSKFIRIHHKINDNETKYVTLTPRHLIYVKRWDKSSFEFLPAIEVRPGDGLKYYDYNQKIHKIVNVTRIETVNLKKSGIYAPLTESGTLVVDNVFASCYSMVKNHKTAQFFFNILNRLNYFINLTSDSYVAYSKFLYQSLNFLQLSNLFLNVNL